MMIIAMPFAGGNKHCYKEFQKKFANFVTIEYPGKGIKSSIEQPSNITQLIDGIIEEILIYVKTNNYILFGHSMGGIVAYELCKKLEEINPPQKLIISGVESQKKISHLESGRFWDAIDSFGFLPNEIKENSEAKQYFESLLRSDFKILEEHEINHDYKLKTSTKILYNKNLDFPFFKWNNISTSIEFIKFNGNNHFFIFNNPKFINYLYQQCSI